MRFLGLTLILVAAAAGRAAAQVPTIIRPIQQAREAVAKSDARTEAAQAVVHEPVVRRTDSTRLTKAAPTGTATKAPATTQAAAKAAPATPAGTKAPSAGTTPPVAAKGAPTASAAAKPAPSDKANTPAAPDKAGTPAAPSDKAGTPAPPTQAAAGKGAPAGTKAPVTPAPAGTKAAPATKAPDSAAKTISVGSTVNTRPELRIDREVFTYDAGGRRDPFVSLFSTSDLRPLFTDLLLVVINYDPQRRNSVAIMRDASTKEQYRVRQGQLIGRMRVSAIEQKRVLFTIDEFGYSRQESLVIGDTTKVRKQ